MNEDASMKDLRLDDFSAWVGEMCEVAVADIRLPMTLVSAEALEGAAREAGGFRLELLGPQAPILAQAVVRVEREGFAHDIFIVPMASDAAGTRYEAIFY